MRELHRVVCYEKNKNDKEKGAKEKKRYTANKAIFFSFLLVNDAYRIRVSEAYLSIRIYK